MFLDVTRHRNPQLIRRAVTFHQSGIIPPNTYVIDVDVLKENTKKLVKTANENDFTLYFMSKQLGRIPALAKMIADAGIDKAVAVDFDEGKVLADHGISIGNIGHLVQPGKNQWAELLDWNPEVVTVFSYERAAQLSKAATDKGIQQDILLKVVGPNDNIYPGQEGGIPIESLSNTVDKIRQLKGVPIVGVTTFPNLQINAEKTGMIPTNNLKTLLQARDILIDKGITVKQVNGPSGTSCQTIPFLAAHGVTHGEPGHGLTGTTPIHAYKELPERPAIIYVSEVSHRYKEYYQVIAGGYYGRSNIRGCLVGHDEGTILDQYVHAYSNSPESIDYYGMIDAPKDFSIEIGDTAIFSFRTQIFVTRAHVALVEGMQSGNPRLIHLERKW
ncbi:YhfX family PLP-dependent enzyme [Virgibacillus sp. 179-BFC.A HS]|uniref:YhfX family PLP-dependent enzyme n=1 Tax=Tigheibacillus jepli TaxID=3035914 RepID=A0ABU5CLS8_9BACI|nr:YhfX family PLP-dependent enzyme [Virgibacillus sp. 179-BFC.A HS]MDY0406739.1 YhfX family PLP-dependent enzyme [Virgibacillus sp. 179-BFC.A HS]